jgi:hypothetical protein
LLLCSCQRVSQKTLVRHLPKLNPCLPLADLGAKSGFAKTCGNCRDSFGEEIDKVASRDKRFHAVQAIHSSQRQLLFYSDFSAIQSNLPQTVAALNSHQDQLYSVLNFEGSLQAAQTESPHLGDLNLFALAVDEGRKLFVNAAQNPAQQWLATLQDHDEFSAWAQIQKGEWRRWNPNLREDDTLLRFLLSEVIFIREALNVLPLAAVVLTDKTHAENTEREIKKGTRTFVVSPENLAKDLESVLAIGK